jgi:carbon storage regulator
MLVLSRKPGECVQIGDSIRVRVIRIGGGRVRIGIEAPKSVGVLRGELKAGGRFGESKRTDVPTRGD